MKLTDQYGYEELVVAAKMSLPDEDKIMHALEMECQGVNVGFNVIPTLNDIVTQRLARRILGQPVEEFRNTALRLYAEQKINESQLWDIVEKVVGALGAAQLKAG